MTDVEKTSAIMDGKPFYPHVKVKLIGRNGNAFAILGNVQRQMEKANLSQREIDKFIEEATSGNYDHMLQTCMKWVTVS